MCAGEAVRSRGLSVDAHWINEKLREVDMSMNRLYKYISGEGALRLFRSGMLRFTQPAEFNDPFEMQPFLKGLADEPVLEKQFHEQFGPTLDPEIEGMLAKLTPGQRALIDGNSIRQMCNSKHRRLWQR